MFHVMYVIYTSLKYDFSECYNNMITEVPNCKSLLCCAPFKMLWPLGYLLFKGLVSALRVLGRVVPIPAITKVYRFYLDVKCHIARSSPDFRTKIVSIEEEIKKHEALGEL